MSSIILYILIAVAFTSFAASIVFSYLNNRSQTIVSGLFHNSTLTIERKYPEYATPNEIVFNAMWAIIYITNALGLLYILIGAFIPPRMSPVKVTPSLTPPLFLIAYSAAFMMTVGWLFAYDNEILELSIAFLILGALFTFLAIGASSRRIQDNLFTLEIKGNFMMWMIRVFVQNPLCILATWLIIAATQNMAEIILYFDSFSHFPARSRGVFIGVSGIEDASLIAMGILFALVVIWFVLENFVWQQYCRFNFTIYPVLIFDLAGVLARITSFEDNINLNRLIILVSVQMAFCCMAFLIRIALLVYKIRARANANS